MTVAELIEKLKNLRDDANVLVVDYSGEYQEIGHAYEDADGDLIIEFR